jgi:hypothetical protein
VTRSVVEPIVKGDEGYSPAHLELQKEAACQLNGVTGAQAVAK